MPCSNDGKLTSADAEFAKFKVMVTEADGSQTAKTLSQLGITEINLRTDATGIRVDGSAITRRRRWGARGAPTRGRVAKGLEDMGFQKWGGKGLTGGAVGRSPGIGRRQGGARRDLGRGESSCGGGRVARGGGVWCRLAG